MYLRCSGVSGFLPAAGNRCHRTCSRVRRVHESSYTATKELVQEARLDFGLRACAQKFLKQLMSTTKEMFDVGLAMFDFAKSLCRGVPLSR